MKKLYTLLTVLILLTGFTFAQISDGEQRSEENRQDQNTQNQPQEDHNSKSSDMPSVTEEEKNSNKGEKPSLPEQASQTAKNVIDAVIGGIAGVFKNIAN